MRNYKYFLYISVLALVLQSGLSQVYKTGDKVEAFINNSWKKATIVKVASGRTHSYEVQTSDAGNKSILINSQNLRVPKKNGIPANAGANNLSVINNTNLHLGKYNLYSGIPTMYIGHIILQADGKYKVAFGTDEDNYEIGKYTFHAASNSIEWLTGLFKNKGWSGKLSTTSGNANRIEFNKATYAETTSN